MQSVACEQGERKCQASQDFRRGQRVLSKDFEDVGKQRHAGAEKNQPDYVERIGALLAVVRQVEIDQDQADKSDGNIDEENEPPVQVTDDESASDGSEHGADQSRNGDEAHGA